MKQFIDKAAVVAEIERKTRTEQGYSSGDAECGYLDCAREIRSFLDTLEVKESEEEKVPTWKKVGPDVGQTILYMDGAESYLERFGYRISLNELDKLPKENNL